MDASTESAVEPNEARTQPQTVSAATETNARRTGMEFGVLAASLGGMAVVVAAVSAAVLLKMKKD